MFSRIEYFSHDDFNAKLGLDWYYRKENLKWYYKGYDAFVISAFFFGTKYTLVFNLKFRERKPTEDELNMEKRLMGLLNEKD